jgi:predicted N-acetyltransferase YhbS
MYAGQRAFIREFPLTMNPIGLNMLATHPDHQYGGAGRMLLRWGTDIADASKVLPCYLEGSPAGHALYRSAGFEDVETLDMDLSSGEVKVSNHRYVMIRPPKVT